MDEIFASDGYCVIDQKYLSINKDYLENFVYQAALNNFHEVLHIINKNELEFGIGVKNGFKEIVQRHPNRYEMTYQMNDSRFDFIFNESILMKLVSKILDCNDYILVNRSFVISMPGCDDQKWHSDGPHMSLTSDLPCYCLNIFIPLIDIDEYNGPTEIKPGSHHYTRDLAKSMLIALIKKQIRPSIAPCLTKGSALLFDYRVLHRGRANRSDHIRPILVYTFAKPWYKDNLNFPSRSIFDSSTTVSSGNHNDDDNIADGDKS